MGSEIIGSFKDSFDTWGYVVLFVYCMGSGYVGILAAGILSSLGFMNIYASIFIAGVGNMFGSSMIVYAVRFQKQDVLKYLNKHRRKIALMHIWLRKYGSMLIVLNKYLYGVKFLVPMAIGMSRYSLKKFFILNFLACFVWAGSLGLVSFYSSRGIEILIDRYGRYSYLVVVFVFVVVAMFFVWLSKVAKPNINKLKNIDKD